MGLRTDLSEIIPENLLPHLPNGYEVLGNIAIISVPPILAPYHDEIIDALLSRKSSLITILNKIGDVQGNVRTAQYHPLFGTQTKSEVKEFGFRYRLDVREVYFSTKMASERKRISDLIVPGETIFVPFAGVGPYAIPAAAKGARVFAVELSYPACSWMFLNALLNSVSPDIHIIQGDALQAIHYIKKRFSRIIIPTPYGLLSKPDIFLSRLTTGGIAHWITFGNENQITECIRILSHGGYLVVRSHRCGNVAPCVSRWILDIRKI